MALYLARLFNCLWILDNFRGSKKIMSEQMQPREKAPEKDRISVPGIFLVFMGVVLLLQSLSVLSWSLWDALWKFWPVLLIIGGLSVLLKRVNEWLVSLVVVAVLLASLFLALQLHDRNESPGQGIRYLSPVESLILH